MTIFNTLQTHNQSAWAIGHYLENRQARTMQVMEWLDLESGNQQWTPHPSKSHGPKNTTPCPPETETFDEKDIFEDPLAYVTTPAPQATPKIFFTIIKFINSRNFKSKIYSINIAGLKGLACLAFPLGS